jgi:hypothetical protein
MEILKGQKLRLWEVDCSVCAAEGKKLSIYCVWGLNFGIYLAKAALRRNFDKVRRRS